VVATKAMARQQNIIVQCKAVIVIVLFIASNILSILKGRRSFAMNGTFVSMIQLQQRDRNMSTNSTNIRAHKIIATSTITSHGIVAWNVTGNMTNVMTAGLHDHGEHSIQKAFVVIVSCIKSMESWTSINGTSLHELFLPSVSRFLTDEERKTYRVEVLLAFDKGDTFWENTNNRLEIAVTHNIPVSFISVVNNRTHHIPFNEACRAAYEYGADYIVRVNDDTEFTSQGWITKATQVLASYDPPNVGVVGPTFHEGNIDVLTHDMVHRTHMEIFDDYYPDEFDNWWLDDWISYVYGDSHTTKMADWVIVHHMYHHGTRYTENRSQKRLLQTWVDRGKDRIQRYLESGNTSVITPVLGTPRVSLVEGPIQAATPPA
jgi:hypothetical protein